MARFPILLSSTHHYTGLVVQDCHVKVMHGGRKGRYWFIKGRQYNWRVLQNCIICKRFPSKPYVAPPPPPLLPVHVQEAPHFANVGIDFAGPLYIKDGKQSLDLPVHMLHDQRRSFGGCPKHDYRSISTLFQKICWQKRIS